MFVIWDIQTGIIIRTIDTRHTNPSEYASPRGVDTRHINLGGVGIEYPGKIMFHGDQGTIVLALQSSSHTHFYIYDMLNDLQLWKSRTLLQQGYRLGCYWIHEDALQFATISDGYKGLMFNIHELQPTLTPPVCVLSSFYIPPYRGEFSFSPASFHASFVTNAEVVVLNVQDSKVLLQAGVAQLLSQPGQFSHNGHFFACGTKEYKIHVWQNTPTGYVPWSILRSRLPLEGISWSPISTSILCWCRGGILLLHPEGHSSTPPPNRNEFNTRGKKHLVAYSANSSCVAVAQERGGIIMVLDHLSGTVWQQNNLGVQIHDIKIVSNTVFAISAYRPIENTILPVGIHKFAEIIIHYLSSSTLPISKYKLIGWELGASGLKQCTYNRALAIDTHAEYLTLSYNCSLIAFTRGKRIFLYDVNIQKILKSIEWYGGPQNIRFSPNQHQLWFIGFHDTSHIGNPYIGKLEVVGSWSPAKVIIEDLENVWSWINHFSPHGYYVRNGSEWARDSRGRNLLWLPHWRIKGWKSGTWEGNFLALVDGQNLVPLIIEFQV